MAKVTRAAGQARRSGAARQRSVPRQAAVAEPQVQAPVETESQLEETATAPGSRVAAFFRSPYLTLVSRLVLGVVFTVSGLAKIGTPNVMASSIKAYEMPLPDALVQAMAVGMPILELAIGIFLLVGLLTRLSAGISIGLTVIFLIAITQAWLRGLNVDCGCFGASGPANGLGAAVMGALGPVGDWLANEKVGPEAIIRDLVFLLMGVHLLIVPTVFSLDALRRRGYQEEVYEEAEAAS